MMAVITTEMMPMAGNELFFSFHYVPVSLSHHEVGIVPMVYLLHPVYSLKALNLFLLCAHVYVHEYVCMHTCMHVNRCVYRSRRTTPGSGGTCL